MIRHLVKELLAERGNLMAEFRVWILKVKPMSDICDDFRCWLVSKYCLKCQIIICFHLWNFSFKKLIYGKLDLSFTFGFFYLSFPRMENALISQLTNWGQGKKIQSPQLLRGGPESGRRNTHASSIAAGGPGSRSPAPKSPRQQRLSRRQVGSVLAHWPVSLAASLLGTLNRTATQTLSLGWREEKGRGKHVMVSVL